jgi:hypothetical protein
MFELNIFIPSNFYIYILAINLKKKNNYNLYLMNDNYYIILYLYNININNFIFLNKNTNSLILKNYTKNSNIKTFNTNLYNFLFSLDYLFYKKLKFTGKGFKIRKKFDNIILYFNTAHLTLMINRNNISLRLLKNKYIFLRSNKYYNYLDGFFFKSVRQNNIFTKRGLRFCRQLTYKKKGKN